MDYETGAIIENGTKHLYTDVRDWSLWGGGNGMASNPSNGTNTVWECSVMSSGTITVIVTWNGPNPVPNNLFVKLHGNSTSQAGGGQANGYAADGLRHLDILWNTSGPTLRESTSEGDRYLYFANPQSVMRIPVTLESYAYSYDTSGATSTGCGVSATASSRAVQVSSDRGVTYHREVGTESGTGWITGVQRANERDVLGVMYGDIEVGLDYVDPNVFHDPLWKYDYSLTYTRDLFGPWNPVFNDWYVTNPTLHWSDGLFSEDDTVPVSDSDDGYGGKAGAYVNGTQQQTVHYFATDDLDGFKADNWFLMKLHGKSQMEEKYKDDYSGPLNSSASGVRQFGLTAFYLATPDPEENWGPDSESVVMSASHSATYVQGWETSASITATVAKIFDAHFGAQQSVSTTSTFSTTTTITRTVPAGSKLCWWCVPSGTVEYWNESQWGSGGYVSDVRVPVVGNLHFVGVDYTIPITTPDEEPYA